MRKLLICVLFAACQKNNIQPPAPIERNDNIILVHFDGYTLSRTIWNYRKDSFYCPPSGYAQISKEEILSRVREKFNGFNVKITTDTADYNNANRYRQRVIVSRYLDSLVGYGYKQSGGMSILGSMSDRGYDIPCFVFVENLLNSKDAVVGAIAHEIGHTLGLRHQYRNEPAIMGKQAYSPEAQWVDGINVDSVRQNDKMLIGFRLGY